MDNLPDSIEQYDRMCKITRYLIQSRAPDELFFDSLRVRASIIMGMSKEDFNLWQEIRDPVARATSTQ